MAYKYVTENNLYNKQTYMYSQYNGIEFLKEYTASRQEYLSKYESLEKSIKEENEEWTSSSSVMRDLLNIIEALKSEKQDKNIIDRINAYIKSFEVRKRIYQEYDSDWKPAGSMNFADYGLYLKFAECLALSYGQTQCLKYFSCLLKVDDTLLSVSDQIIKKELLFFNQLAGKNGISLEE